jgi:hypothetical protein
VYVEAHEKPAKKLS